MVVLTIIAQKNGDTVYHEKTHTACTASTPERPIQFLILLVQEIVKDYLRPLRVSSPYDTDEVL